MTPKKIAVMSKNYSNACWKCQKHEGSFYHMWWSCEKAKIFWTNIHTEMIKILKYTIPKDPEMYLLGLNMEKMNSKDQTLIWYLITAARLLYAQYWKNEKTPEVEEWLEKIIHLAEMDKMTKKLRDLNEDLYLSSWKKRKDYLENYWKMKDMLWNLENF